jgi:hypothetical protein
MGYSKQFLPLVWDKRIFKRTSKRDCTKRNREADESMSNKKKGSASEARYLYCKKRKSGNDFIIHKKIYLSLVQVW